MRDFRVAIELQDEGEFTRITRDEVQVSVQTATRINTVMYIIIDESWWSVWENRMYTVRKSYTFL